ncbi:MAG: aromatic-ring-hydroxylating dioxygenase subunit beta [Pseudomonadota bacterium]|nr:aromatic-ring-hydroxylating dioxygenase subunit beta [Pseudomonadota bacterium]MEC8774381.1 aromatic-ring-hydroxylating dioxygenase subunit beta [Pseudomonadota bacterium]MEC9183258.1 aromatic-ring-hydroxylating dioxygenase subunit beta [Pseudomonadota bacterium]
MPERDLLAEGVDLLSREALYIDMRRWEEWIDLYHEDAIFWAPAWRNDEELTEDIHREISLFYFESRAGIEDRVWRIKTKQAPALYPLARTTHVITNSVLETPPSENKMTLHSAWTCHTYSLRDRSQHAFFGRYEHDLERFDSKWKITRKKVILMNDYIPAVIDVFCV